MKQEGDMLVREKWHASLTDERIMDAAERQMIDLDNPGFCLACGNEQGGCEPDARRIRCEVCGENKVYGAQELMLSLDLFGDGAQRAPTTIWPVGTNENGD
jgi:hypothetical protein